MKPSKNVPVNSNITKRSGFAPGSQRQQRCLRWYRAPDYKNKQSTMQASLNISNRNLRDSDKTTGGAEEAEEEADEDNEGNQEDERKNLKKNHKLPCKCNYNGPERIKPLEAAERCNPSRKSHCRAR